MNKILAFIITFLVALVITMGFTYIMFHYIYKQDIFSKWYVYFCYCLDIIASICKALESTEIFITELKRAIR